MPLSTVRERNTEHRHAHGDDEWTTRVEDRKVGVFSWVWCPQLLLLVVANENAAEELLMGGNAEEAAPQVMEPRAQGRITRCNSCRRHIGIRTPERVPRAP